MAVVLRKSVDTSGVVNSDHGFKVVSKVFKQRLFSELYPLVQAKTESNSGSTMMMHLCSTVNLEFLVSQNKLQELIPMALGSLGPSQTNVSVKLTSLTVLRKILLQHSSEQGETNLGQLAQ